MGNQRQYLAEGGFTQYLYQAESPKVTINGVTGRMVSKLTDPKSTHDGLPNYSNTCDIYFKKGTDGLASQAKLYKNRHTVLDFDWDHDHKNADGTVFHKGRVHVQEYKLDAKGNAVRQSLHARLMTAHEIAQYGAIIHYFNPNVNF